MNHVYMQTGIILASQFHNNDMHGGATKPKKKWTTLVHNGVKFPPEYIPHSVPVIYNGEKIILDPEAEEDATLYAKFTITDHVKNNVFRKNFWNDWKDSLGPNHKIKDLVGCDFGLIYDYILKTKEEKKLEKQNKPKNDVDENAKYKIAIVDGKEQGVGNFMIEPKSIFIGRGCNKNLGKIKKRIYPEDVTINIGKDAPIPETIPGHQWGQITHNQYSEWLASWKDTIMNKTKYMWLSSHSDFKSKSDVDKFDLARKLKKKIKTIRSQNEIELKSSNKKMRQVATALYFIDKYALRVGNEKSEDTADTFGITSLLTKHIELLGDGKIRLNFLGKDSVKYDRLLTIDPVVYANIEEFTKDKQPSDGIFDLITSNDINKYLQEYMKGLTAKVFRTYNASNLFQKELQKISNRFENYAEDDKINLLLDEFNKANGKVALLCNHQKNINKSNVGKAEKLNLAIKTSKAKIRTLTNAKNKNPEKVAKEKNKLKKLRSKKELLLELKNISLETSKANYIDPRITVSFLKKNNIPIEKLFTKTLMEKFKWAFDTDSSFKF